MMVIVMQTLFSLALFLSLDYLQVFTGGFQSMFVGFVAFKVQAFDVFDFFGEGSWLSPFLRSSAEDQPCVSTTSQPDLTNSSVQSCTYSANQFRYSI